MATFGNFSNSIRTNPFYEDYDAPPFDRITDNDFEPAVMRGIAEQEREINDITTTLHRPTFDNTIAALDSSGHLLDRVTDVFYNLLSAASDERKEQLAAKFAPLLAEHHNNIMLNRQLFARVKYVKSIHSQYLTPEELQLLEKTYLAFKRNGALLDKKGKERLRAYTAEAAKLTVKFQTNLLHARQKFRLDITDKNDLEGVSSNVLDSIENHSDGEIKWTLTLDEPVYVPLMTYCKNRELRHKMYMAYNSVCLHEGDDCNVKVCSRLVNIRRKMAQLLGYATYADYVLEERMAMNSKNVRKLFDALLKNYLPTAHEEVKRVEDFAKTTEGEDFELQAWDFSYYSHLLKLSLFDIDSEKLRPYFELSKVQTGIFNLAHELYGITITINPDIPVYAPDVKAYDVTDSDKKWLGVLYVDFHPRKGKQGGAWMTTYGSQYIEKSKNIRPYAAIVMNLTPPTPQRPSLLSLREVTTFLHEFGHSLHALFANTEFRSLSGTNVYWDFVELPSQIMENFAIEKKFLRTFAVHYKTGEPLPDELANNIIRSRNFNVAYATVRQVAYGLLDMAYYTLDKSFESDLEKFERKAMKPAQLLPPVKGTNMTVQFGHIMSGGYAAGYYSYKWAELLEADAYEEFKADGVISRKTGMRFRNCILAAGGTEHPMTLYKRFRGKEPTIDALLARDGISKSHGNEKN